MSKHRAVLLSEATEKLNLKEGAVVVDATLGSGGHAQEILKEIGKKGKLIALDRDRAAIEHFKEVPLVCQSKTAILVEANFSNLKSILKELGVKKVTAVLADLGISSDQLEDEKRGFSFQKVGPLDMRLDLKEELTAWKIINYYPLQELERVIREFGEERYAGRIARKIFQERRKKKIETAKELATLIEKVVPRGKFQKIHPATRTFQALRIETNQELENLKKFLPQAIEVLVPGGRLAVISFHSLEDRIVKNIFRENARGCICPKNFPQCQCGREAKIKIITKKPVVPGAEELSSNPRSRSAKLRVCEKL
jgi:16S rRNA (cytosine1402-N4)-methyltransferase